MAKAHIDFWFDFASTYSYPAAMRVEALACAHEVAVRWRPFLLGPIFAARATMRAVIVYDHEHRRPRFERDVAGWIADGRVKYREDRVDGLDQAPHLFARLMRGENFGKCVVKLA